MVAGDATARLVGQAGRSQRPKRRIVLLCCSNVRKARRHALCPVSIGLWKRFREIRIEIRRVRRRVEHGFGRKPKSFYRV